MQQEIDQPPKLPMVLVRWHDAGTGADEEEAASHYRLSLAFKTSQTPSGIWLTMEDDQLSPIHFIPWGMIISITPVPAP